MKPVGFITKEDVAQMLHCNKFTVDRWRKLGILPYYKISRRVLFREDDILQALQRCHVRDRNWQNHPTTTQPQPASQPAEYAI